ncbi:MAG TPA: hypothetical protein VNE71_02275, partial [Myxococcota bacterium]|nr:hypothetical protein [Myxococcota bacterium]
MRRGARLLLAAVGGVAGFAAACALLTRAIAPAPAEAVLRADWLAANGARFDTVFIGSSRTVRQVMPATFDGAMAESGRPTHSFNLGAAGMRAPEDAFVLERALAGRREPLQFLLVECNPVRLGIPEQDRGTTRAVYWHDRARVKTLWNRVWAHPTLAPDGQLGLGVGVRHLGEFADHLRHWAWNASRMGRAPELVDPLIRAGVKPFDGPALGPDGDGYDPGRKRRPMNAEEVARYERALADAVARGKPDHYGDSESQAELARKRALARRFGAELVLVAPPTVGAAFAPLPGSGFLFLDFSSPARYPELFAVEHR